MSTPHSAAALEQHFLKPLYQLCVLWTQSEKFKAGEMYQDSGCNRCIAGEQIHERWQKYLLQYGIRPIRVEKQEEFVFGNNEVEMSTCAWTYPVFLEGRAVGVIDIASVKVPCPALWSKRMMNEWKIILDFEKKQTYTKKHDMYIPFKDDIPIIQIFQLPDPLTRDHIPDQFRCHAVHLAQSTSGTSDEPGTRDGLQTLLSTFIADPQLHQSEE